MAYPSPAGRATLQQLLAAIALALILQSLAQLAFSPETRAVLRGTERELKNSDFIRRAHFGL